MEDNMVDIEMDSNGYFYIGKDRYQLLGNDPIPHPNGKWEYRVRLANEFSIKEEVKAIKEELFKIKGELTK